MRSPKETASDHLVILVVDDDSILRNRLCRAFRDRGCETYQAETAEETCRLAAGVSPDLVLLDLKMPGLNGIDLIQNIKKQDNTYRLRKYRDGHAGAEIRRRSLP